MEKFSSTWKSATQKPKNLIQIIRSGIRDLVLFYEAKMNIEPETNFLRCLYCHYVFDDQLKEFEIIINTLKTIGNFVNTKTCLEMLKGEKKIEGKNFHLSFDDGFKNNRTNVLPILLKNDVPAIFFVPSGLIGSNYSKVEEYCLKKTNYNKVIEMLNWDDLKYIIDKGFEIGSHTKNHFKLSTLIDFNQINDEISGSKSVLEKKLGIICNYFSWPYGTLNDIDHDIIALIKNSDYKASFGAFRGKIEPKVTDKFIIPRHHFEVQWPLQHIRYFSNGGRE